MHSLEDHAHTLKLAMSLCPSGPHSTLEKQPQNMMVAPFLLRVLHSSWNAMAPRMRESVEQSMSRGSTAKATVMQLKAKPRYPQTDQDPLSLQALNFFFILGSELLVHEPTLRVP